MNNPLTNPLQSLLAKATKLPANTGETDRFRSRFDRQGQSHWVVCDVSGSMDGAAWGGRTKIDLLRDAVRNVWDSVPDPRRLMQFSSDAIEIPGPASIGAPAGGTALHVALAAVGSLAPPAQTLVISDGQPDDAAAALAEADRLPGVIDVLYIGPDSDAAAIAFMRDLARTGGGRVVVNDLRRSAAPALAVSIRRLLPGGQP